MQKRSERPAGAKIWPAAPENAQNLGIWDPGRRPKFFESAPFVFYTFATRGESLGIPLIVPENFKKQIFAFFRDLHCFDKFTLYWLTLTSLWVVVVGM